jgi:hypothetical protein
MVAYIHLVVDQGTDFENILVLADDVTNEIINVSSYVVTSQMRHGYYSANSTNLTCAISDAANGEISISLTAGQTANIRAGRYVFDVKANTGADIVRLLEGVIEITPAVTL